MKLSYSSLKQFKKSPQHFLYYKEQKFEPTESMILGQAFDCKVLEPETFDKRFAIMPNVDGRTKEGRAVKEQFISESEGKTILKSDQLAQIEEMEKSLNNSLVAVNTLRYDGNVQSKIEWKDQGLDFIGYIDKDCGEYLIDVKSCQDASPEGFMRAAYNLDYSLQAYMYLKGQGQADQFVYVCVETKPPYAVAVYKASDDFIEYGKQTYERLVNEFLHWQSEGCPVQSYDFYQQDGFGVVDLPAWAKKQLA